MMQYIMVDPSSPIILYPTLSDRASIDQIEPGRIRLGIPAGPKGHYRLAQIDDYQKKPRKKFTWKAPVELNLVARASSMNLPGTWGFGFWNDPFSLVLPGEARAFRLPILPNTAWFFFASPENYLSLRDDQPAAGNLAAVFCSPPWPGALSLLMLPFLPMILVQPLARRFRRVGQMFIEEKSTLLLINPEEPHAYRIKWETSQIEFWVDGQLMLRTNFTPRGPLGFLAWIDNQYAAYFPNGKIRYGTLANISSAWIEIEKLRINHQTPLLLQDNQTTLSLPPA